MTNEALGTMVLCGSVVEVSCVVRGTRLLWQQCVHLPWYVATF